MSTKRFHWVGLLIAAAIMLPPQSLWADRDENACVTRNAKRTFIQLWRSDAELSDEQWDRRLDALVKLGFDEIIVQWSTYGNISFFDNPHKNFESAACLGALIRSAARKNVGIQVGLQYDPKFWSQIEATKNVNIYLKSRLKEITESLDPLLSVVARFDPSGSVVKSWYISDEIDDLNWENAKRRTALTAYLQAIRQRLGSKREKWPVAISGYATGTFLPNQWARFWKSLLSVTGIDTFLFQDGIGTGKMTLTDVSAYLSVLAPALKGPGKRLGVVVEIFSMDPSSDVFRTESAVFGRIAEQLKLADKYTQNGITVFSAPDHLIDQQSPHGLKLHQSWLADQRACGVTTGGRSLMRDKQHHEPGKQKK